MGTFEKFEDMDAWKIGMELAGDIYRVTSKGAFAKDYALRDQIRRSAISIVSNIAEGYERGGSAEFIQFLAITKGSTGELRAQLHIAMEQGYVTREEFDRLYDLAKRTGSMAGGLMRYLKKSAMKGSKYK